jgi:hypothetical protein
VELLVGWGVGQRKNWPHFKMDFVDGIWVINLGGEEKERYFCNEEGKE